jgi:Cof subfamily protein (haloacid dehalogenase superfamily)
MKRSDFKVVALDLDGTVLDSAGRVSERFKRAVTALARRGVRTVLCTGRRWRTTLEVLNQVTDAHPVAICSAGALIKDGATHRTLRAVALPRRAALLTDDALRERGLVPITLLDRPINQPELLMSECDRAASAALPYIAASAKHSDYYPGRHVERGTQIIEVFALDEEERVRPVEAALRSLLAGVANVTCMKQPRYGPTQWSLEVHSARATKWNALKWLLRRWRVKARQVVAAGDDVNDVPMLKAAGLSFAMANATPAAKAAAQRVTASNDEDGVCLALSAAFGLDL